MKKIGLLFCFIYQFAQAQINDTVIAMPLIGFHFGGDIPIGELSNRFGPNLCTGVNVMYKTKRNYIFGIDGNYMFSKNLNEDPLINLRTEKGFIIDNAGYPADVRISERIVNVNAHFGKVFPWLAANPNSGLFITGGFGFMQHQFHFVDAQKQTSAIGGDIVRGLDKLTRGASIHQFIGYLFLSNNRLLNFYTGFESYQGFTKSVRKLNYDTGLPDTKTRVDVLVGFRFGWILPLYSRIQKKYYYY